MNFLQNIFENLSNTVGKYLPSTISAILILIIGRIVAGFVKKLIIKIVKRTNIDEKLNTGKITLSDFIGKLVYFLIMIFVFTLALEKLGMSNVLEPIQNLLSDFLGFIPNIVGSGLVAYIGYMLATVVSELVGLSSDAIKKLTPKLKLPENIEIVSILKKIVFIFIFIPLLIVALNILNMEAISAPATNMLEQFFVAIPKILVAVIILILFIVGGRFVSQILKDLLQSLKLDDLLSKMSLNGISKKTSIPNIVGNTAYFFIILLGLMTAIEKLEFFKLTEILNKITVISGNIVFGLIVLVIGNWISSMAYHSLAKNKDNSFVASIIRVCVLAIFLAMGLKTMGIANGIINMAFGITLGTIAVTIALSFGLGGREAAGKQMEKILKKFNKKD